MKAINLNFKTQTKASEPTCAKWDVVKGEYDVALLIPPFFFNCQMERRKSKESSDRKIFDELPESISLYDFTYNHTFCRPEF